jgi:hypothetical protein
MSKKLHTIQIARILYDLNVPFRATPDGKIWAVSMDAQKKEYVNIKDLTGLTAQELQEWLGH